MAPELQKINVTKIPICLYGIYTAPYFINIGSKLFSIYAVYLLDFRDWYKRTVCPKTYQYNCGYCVVKHEYRNVFLLCLHWLFLFQIFSSYGLPLKELDFSHNSLRRLPDRLLAGIRGNITKLVLADNLLGDNLNPIFSTAEFHNLPALEELDLSGNSIRGLEEGLLIGCDVLKVCINIEISIDFII